MPKMMKKKMMKKKKMMGKKMMGYMKTGSLYHPPGFAMGNMPAQMMMRKRMPAGQVTGLKNYAGYPSPSKYMQKYHDKMKVSLMKQINMNGVWLPGRLKSTGV